MKQYVVDEFRLEDYEKVKTYLEEHCKAAGLSGVYWLTVPDQVLTELQRSHTQCQPYYVGIELYEDRMACGLLIRSSKTIRCHCAGYTTTEQRNWLIDTVDSMIDQIGIIA
jgi:hypothetical protein